MSTTLETLGLMAGLMLAVLLALMDQTVVSTALPTIVADLSGLDLYAWVFSAYLLAQTSFMPVFGKLSDLFGRRRLFLIALVAFMAGSALCGQARTMEQLIVFRGLQGIGGAGLMPVALAILGHRYGPRERARLQGILAGGAGLAVIAGPSVGSFIVEHASWRWVFYVNLPLGVLATLFVLAFLHEPRELGRARPAIDYAGALALTAAVAALLVGAFLSRDQDWTAVPVLAALGLAAILAGLFLAIERRAREPILPLEVFADRTVSATAAVALIRAVAMYALVIFVPLLVQGVLGGSSEDARNELIVFAIPGIAAAVAAGLLVARGVPYRILIISGLALTGLGSWLAAALRPGSGLTELALILIVAGLGVGLTQVTFILVFQNTLPRRYVGVASSLSQFLNNLAGTVGVSLLGTFQAGEFAAGIGRAVSGAQLPPQFARVLADGAAVERVLVSPQAAAQLPAQLLVPLRDALASSLAGAFTVGVVLTVVALPAALLIGGAAQRWRAEVPNAVAMAPAADP